MIRCKDIAVMVGVSRQAVTAVLNNSRPNCVSKEKRAEILKVAAEHNYRPNHAAVALKTGRSNLIGIVMPPWENLYIAELCMGIQRSLIARNYTPFFAIDRYQAPDPENLELLLSRHVSGMITVASPILPDDIGIPVVSYFHDDPRFDSVCPDFERDARLYIEHLKAYGHRKIGYLGLCRDRKFNSLIAEAERAGLEFPARWRVNYTPATCEDSFDELLQQNEGKDLPTALIVHNDAGALKLMRRIHDRGFRIPEDFSIIGHDNVSYSASTLPALSTISFGAPDDIAEPLVSLLMERMEKPDGPRKKILMKSELIIRESVLNLNG